MTNNIKILAESVTYSDYKSIVFIYKRKKYKIVVRKAETGRVTVHGYLLTNAGFIDLFNESDLPYNTNNYYIKSNSSNEIIRKLILERVEHAKEYIQKIF